MQATLWTQFGRPGDNSDQCDATRGVLGFRVGTSGKGDRLENYAAGRFLRFFEALEDAAVPSSELIRIVDQWLENQVISSQDREWLNRHCGARLFRLSSYSPLDPTHTVVEHYEVTFDEPITPRTMPMRELEAACTSLFLEFLQEHYRKLEDVKSPQVKRCVQCGRLFRTMQGYPLKVTCSKGCGQRRWESKRDPKSPSRRNGDSPAARAR